jgi:uncharacterized phage protein gp47/JayE
VATLAYLPPSITAAGLTIPSYQSILQDNITQFLNIYGQNQYIEPDSAIYQLLSILSLKQYDTMQAVQLAYNQSSPLTAVGAGLDREVKMNGLSRDAFTFSTALLTLSGVSGTMIPNGYAQDQSGNLWSLPQDITLSSIPVGVTATCTTPGAIAAEPNTITIINTPTPGWTSVTNSDAAVPGASIETDSALRARQAISVALPAPTPLASTIAQVLATPGVVRVAPGYPTPGGPGSSIENPTGAVDSWGNPAHSLTMVVDCSNTQTVANAIYASKTIGCTTYGTTKVPVTDVYTGVIEDISFYLPTIIPICVLVNIAGYGTTPTSAVQSAIQAAIVSYLNSLAIGETVSFGAVFYEAMAQNANMSNPAFGVQSVLIGAALATTTAPTVAGTPTITVASATGIAVGQYVFGAGIPPGTTVTALNGLVVTLSMAPTITSVNSVAVAFAAPVAADYTMPNNPPVAPSFACAAQGIATNIAVVIV